MDFKLELVAIPVTDIDRAKSFYVDKVGFHPDHDVTVSEEIRFVQLTPPGSACSIALGKGLSTRRQVHSKVSSSSSPTSTPPAASWWSGGSR